MTERSALVLAPGPRPAQRRLLDEVERALGEVDPSRRASPPVRVIVPSRVLRDHLLSEIARRHGRPAVGIVVQTLAGAAFEILDRADEPAPGAAALFDVVVGRAARRTVEFAALLERWETTGGRLSATVRDLLDAGFEPATREVLEECVREAWPDGPRRRRVFSLLALAGDVHDHLAALAGPPAGPVGRASDAMARADRLLAERGPALLPALRVFVTGFADVTGRAGGLLKRIVDCIGGTVIIDRPPPPGRPDGPPTGFTARIEQLFSGLPREELDPVPPSGMLELIAPGPEAEMRAIAERIRRLLDEGIAPEEIGVVFRQPTLHEAAALARHFHRLGIPFSAEALPAAVHPSGRRLIALAELISEGGRAAADRLLDAMVEHELEGRLSDLRLALRAHGLVRLDDLARVDVRKLRGAGEDLLLPVPGRGEPPGDDDDENGTGGGVPRVRHRRIPRKTVARVACTARAVLGVLESLPRTGPWGAYAGRVVELAHGILGWARAPEPGGGADAAREAMDRTVRLIPDGFELTREEALEVLTASLDQAARSRATPPRAGVRVLDALAARGVVFRRVFLPAMVRDVFPRVIEDDPLLPDALRQRLEMVLPDIPVKARGHDEERHLFRQLVASAESVVFSRPQRGRDGRGVAESPLLAELRAAGIPLVRERARPTHGLERVDDVERMPALLTAFEAAERARLHGLVDDEGAARLLAAAHEEAWSLAGLAAAGLDAHPVAAARTATARELDIARRDLDLGPFFGFVGRVTGDPDPRRREAAWPVTTIERYATCPWQMLLTRLLRIEPAPDPFAALPAPDRRLVGSVVHRVVASLATGRDDWDRTRRRLHEVLEERPRRIDPPDGTRLPELLAAAAGAVLEEEGLGVPGLDRLLALRARPYVERAIALIGRHRFASRGAEVLGSISLPGTPPAALEFRADLALVDPEGRDALVDLKTGRVPGDLAAARPETISSKLLKATASGLRLQAAAYARALAEAGRNGLGGYLHCNPSLEERRPALLPVEAGQGDFDRALATAVGRAVAGIEQGYFTPRVVELGPRQAGEPRACGSCPVREACRQGDSSASLRLRWWYEAPRRGQRDPHPGLRAVLERGDEP